MCGKRYLKTTLKWSVILFALTLFLTNCEKEAFSENKNIEQESKPINNSLFSITTIESSEIQTNTNLVGRLTKLNEKLTAHSKSAKSKDKDKYSEKYDFTINTEFSKYIESADGTYHSYTFLVNRSENNGKLENLVVSLEPDGSYKMVLMAYDLTIEDKQNLQQVLANGLSEKVTTTLIEDDDLASTIFSKGIPSDDSTTNNLCYEILYVVTWCGGTLEHPEGYEANGTECPAHQEQIVGRKRYCTAGGSNSGGTTYSGSDGGSTPTGGTSSGGGDGSATGSPSPTGPVTTPMLAWEAIEKCMNGNINGVDYLNAGALSWLQVQNEFDILPIHNYLHNNQCSTEAKVFAELALEALMEDSDLEFEALLQFYSDMTKQCQALIFLESIFKSNTAFTNLIKDAYLISTDNDINLKDFPVGSGTPVITSNEGGRTNPNKDTNADTGTDIINIEFNEDYLDQATNLGFVNTFFHEVLHAHIFHLYYDGELLTTYPAYTNLNTALNNWFADGTNITLEGIADQEMHNIYVDFIDPLAESLVAYASNNNIQDVNLEYAKKLVWGGLNGYDVFTNNLTTAQQNEAQTLLAYENFNTTSHAKGTKPCN